MNFALYIILLLWIPSVLAITNRLNNLKNETGKKNTTRRAIEDSYDPIPWNGKSYSTLVSSFNDKNLNNDIGLNLQNHRIDGLWTKNNNDSQMHRSPYFPDLDAHQSEVHASINGAKVYRVLPLQRNQNFKQTASSDDHEVIIALKQHDPFGGSQGGGLWDNSGFNFGMPWAPVGHWPNNGPHGGYEPSGISGGGTSAFLSTKKAGTSKALFALIAPLVFLAVFGPILATQTMLPWVMGGLTSVNTVATGRKRRSARDYFHASGSRVDPRQAAEIEKRLQMFLAVQEYMANSGQYYIPDQISASFLRCQGYMDNNNKCLQRIACEYADKKSALNPFERRITKLVLQNIMSNPNVSPSVKGRLSKGAMFGRNHPKRCFNYWCEIVDGPAHVQA